MTTSNLLDPGAPPSAVLHRNLRATLPLAVSGLGSYLVDASGRRYLDASGGAAVSCLGHAHPRVVAAIREQVGRLPYAHSVFFANEPAETLAARLVAAAPKGFGRGRVAFVGSGSEAMEVALKLARQHFIEKGEPARSHFIARRMSYHGNTLGALAIGGHPARRAIYEPMLMQASHIAPCYAYRYRKPDETEASYGARVADELETEILRVGPGRVAAFVAEPVVGATLGSVPAVAGYFARIRAITERHGVLFIADEVMCGMGRTGSLFAIAEEGVSPDIITIAKGLGAGYQPIGAALASERVLAPIMENSGRLANGHTYMSHAVACAASLAVLEALETDGLIQDVSRRGTELASELARHFGQHPHVGDIRGRGLLYSLELVQDRASKKPFPRQAGLAEKLRLAALECGLVCYPASGCADGTNGDHVLLAPPYTIASEEIGEIGDRLEKALALADVGSR
ncbi:MAG: aspartate aminotransferase family protein [Acetobacteraceae bacterium]